jgi:hypothetical protein
MLSLPVGFQRLQPVARWNAQVRKHPRLIQQTKLPQGHVLNVGRQSPAPPADQINSVSGSAKLWIMIHYNVTRYSAQLLAFIRFQF